MDFALDDDSRGWLHPLADVGLRWLDRAGEFIARRGAQKLASSPFRADRPEAGGGHVEVLGGFAVATTRDALGLA